MGYPQELFVEQPVDEEFLCSICRDVLEQPVMIESCEHIFCQTCLSTWRSENSICPLDREPFTASRPPHRTFLNFLHRLKLACKYAGTGCMAGAITLGGLQEHDGQCKGNPNCIVECSGNCGASLKQAQLLSHNCVAYLKAQLATAKDQHETQKVVFQQQLQRNSVEITRLKSEIRNLRAAAALEVIQNATPALREAWLMNSHKSTDIFDAVAEVLLTSFEEANLDDVDVQAVVKSQIQNALNVLLGSEWTVFIYGKGLEPPLTAGRPFPDDPGVDIYYRNCTLRIWDEGWAVVND